VFTCAQIIKIWAKWKEEEDESTQYRGTVSVILMPFAAGKGTVDIIPLQDCQITVKVNTLKCYRCVAQTFDHQLIQFTLIIL
jgi:hypothetical protein